jgi:hypothetical protein
MNPLYFCHIPKTAGHYVEETLFSALNQSCKNSDVDTNINLKHGHYGWSPVRPETYIFAITRNPINRTVSHFVYYYPEVLRFEVNQIKNLMFDFLHKNEFMHNYQTKYLCSLNADNHPNDGEMDQGTDGYEEKFNRINKLLKTETINPETLASLYYEFCNVLELNYIIENISFPDYRIMENISSAARGIRSSLTKSEVSYLSEINYLDFELYERGE